MVELTAENDSTTSAHAIPAHVQLLAVAWMRWRMFINGFRRPPTGARQVIGLVFTIVLRIILWPIMAFWVIGAAVGVVFWRGWRSLITVRRRCLCCLAASSFSGNSSALMA